MRIPREITTVVSSRSVRFEALTDDSETAASLSELRDRAVQHTEVRLITDGRLKDHSLNHEYRLEF